MKKMMIYHSKGKLPTHQIILHPVAGELLKGQNPYDIKQMDIEGKLFDVLDLYDIKPKEPHPEALFMLATGKRVEKIDIWRKYYRSKAIYLFILKPSNDRETATSKDSN